MNLLIVGATTAGSYQIRGIQLGGALGARVTLQPEASDFRWADVVVLIKRAGRRWALDVHRAGRPLVWDAVDFWRSGTVDEADARHQLAEWLAAIRPALMIGATAAMAEAGGGRVLYHHSRPGLTAKPVRDRVEMVAYEGAPGYLGRWQAYLTDICRRRGWSLAINPPNLADADIVVAFRHGQWAGWPARQWKSNVKLANAMAAGRPLICQPEAGYVETASEAGVLFVADGQQLEQALDQAADLNYRRRAHAAMTAAAGAYAVDHIAVQYRRLLESIVR